MPPIPADAGPVGRESPGRVHGMGRCGRAGAHGIGRIRPLAGAIGRHLEVGRNRLRECCRRRVTASLIARRERR